MKRVVVTATPVKGKDLEPGDLFSIYGQEYWDWIDHSGSIGERVYVRTNAPASRAPDPEEDVFRITLHKFDPDDVLGLLRGGTIQDPYGAVAVAIFGDSPNAVTPEHRERAKRICYMIGYGG